MELVLGVSVAGNAARLALVESSSPDNVIDQYVVELSDTPTQTLATTIIDTDRMLAADGHRLTATQLCWANGDLAADLLDGLAEAGLANVTVVTGSEAATSFARGAAASAGLATTALLYVDGDTARLSVVGADAANTSLVAAEPVANGGTSAAITTLLDRLREEPGGAERVYLVSASDDASVVTEQLRAASPIPLHAAEEPAFAMAQGAALAAAAVPLTGSVPPDVSLASVATALGPVAGQQLAYSMADDEPLGAGYGNEYDESAVPLQTPMTPLSHPFSQPFTHTDDPSEREEAAPAATARPKVLLMGSTIAAVVVVGFAVLAVGVAIGIKPTVSSQAIRDVESVPGKYLPVMPGQGTEPATDNNAYLPPVVPVIDAPPASGGGGAGGNTVLVGSTSSGGSGGGFTLPDTGTGTVVISNPGTGGVSGPPPPPLGGFNLSDWLPQGMNIVLGQSPWAQQDKTCKPGDIACFYKTVGCLPADLSCLNKKYGDVTATKVCSTPDLPGCQETVVLDKCETSGDPTCGKPTVYQTCTKPGDKGCAEPPEALCTAAGNATCAPKQTEGTTESVGSSSPPSDGRTSTPPTDGGTTTPPTGPSTSSEVTSAEPTAGSTPPSSPPTSPIVTSTVPSAVSTPPTSPPIKTTTEVTTEKTTQAPAPAVTTQAPPPPVVTTQAPAPVVTQAPAPVVTQAPAPVVTQAPAPVVTQAPAPVVVTPEPVAPAPVVVTPEPVAPPVSSSSGSSSSGSSSSGSGSGSSPETTVAAVP